MSNTQDSHVARCVKVEHLLAWKRSVENQGKYLVVDYKNLFFNKNGDSACDVLLKENNGEWVVVLTAITKIDGKRDVCRVNLNIADLKYIVDRLLALRQNRLMVVAFNQNNNNVYFTDRFALSGDGKLFLDANANPAPEGSRGIAQPNKLLFVYESHYKPSGKNDYEQSRFPFKFYVNNFKKEYRVNLESFITLCYDLIDTLEVLRFGVGVVSPRSVYYVSDTKEQVYFYRRGDYRDKNDTGIYVLPGAAPAASTPNKAPSVAPLAPAPIQPITSPQPIPRAM